MNERESEEMGKHGLYLICRGLNLMERWEIKAPGNEYTTSADVGLFPVVTAVINGQDWGVVYEGEQWTVRIMPTR